MSRTTFRILPMAKWSGFFCSRSRANGIATTASMNIMTTNQMMRISYPATSSAPAIPFALNMSNMKGTSLWNDGRLGEIKYSFFILHPVLSR